MPMVRIVKNDDHLCTVGSNGLFMISVGVSGDLWSEEASHLNVTGGTEHEGGKTDFLIWEFDHRLHRGDDLHFSFQEGDVSSREPELFQAATEREGSHEPTPIWPPSQEEIAAWEAKPLENADLAWHFALNDGPARVFRPEGGRQHLSFGLLWNNRRPERIRLSLHSTSLRDIVARTGRLDYVTEYVPIGSRFCLQIGA